MRKTTKGKGFAGAVVITVLVAAFMLLLTAALLEDYFGCGAGGGWLPWCCLLQF